MWHHTFPFKSLQKTFCFVSEFSRGLSHPPTSTARSESSPSRHPGYGGLRSALKKPVYPGQVSDQSHAVLTAAVNILSLNLSGKAAT